MLNTANISYTDGDKFVLHLKLSDGFYSSFTRPIDEEITETCLIISKNVSNYLVTIYDRNNESLISKQWKDIINHFTPLYFCVNNERIKLKYNYPEIISVELPQVILSTFECYPKNFVIVNSILEDCKFRWFLKRKNGKWIQRSTNFRFTPTKSDANSFVKVAILPKAQNNCGKWKEVECEYAIGFFDCTLYPFYDSHRDFNDNLCNNNFRIMTYNVLSPNFCFDDQGKSKYPHCCHEFLSLDYRKNILMYEILGYHSDIVCLQEVMKNFYVEDLNQIFTKHDYRGVFNETEQEGLAIFFNQNRFKLLHSHVVVFPDDFISDSNFSDLTQLLKENDLLFAQVLSLQTSLQLVLIQSIDNPTEGLLIANVHFTADDSLRTLRLIQIGLILIYLNDFYNRKLIDPTRISVLLCGVFNDNTFFRTYCLDFTTEDKKEPFIQLLQEKLGSSTFGGKGADLHTKFTKDETFFSDRILYQNRNMNITQANYSYHHKCIQMKHKFPSFYFPSDHTPIVLDFQWKPIVENKNVSETKAKSDKHVKTVLEILFNSD